MLRSEGGRTALAIVIAMAGLGCSDDEACKEVLDQPAAKEPVREAAESRNLRVFAAQVAAGRACKSLRGKAIGIPGESGDDTYAGTIVFESCSAEQEGVSLDLAGQARGWLWVSRQKDKAGAEFELAEYIPFELSISLAGDIDIAYAPKPHVLTAWLTPKAYDARVRPIGEVDVESEGVWSKVVGTAGDVVGEGPDEVAAETVQERGQNKVKSKLREGVTATLGLCSGDVDVDFGHHESGAMLTPASEKKSLDDRGLVHPGGMLVLGPEKVRGAKVIVEVESGPGVHAAWVCAEKARRLAAGFITRGELPSPEVMGGSSITQKQELEPTGLECNEAMLVFRSLPETEAASRFRWGLRGTRDSEPLLDCAELGAR